MVVLKSLADLELVRLLTDGAVGVIPTDTVYGIVARAADPKATARLYRTKHREGKPGTIVAADVSQLLELGITYIDLESIEHLWPASLSIVVSAPPELEYLDQGAGSLAVRVPESATLQALLQQTGPLLTSSANLPGQPTAATIYEAQQYFGDTVDFYVDDESGMTGVASTIVRKDENGNINVLRQGAVRIT